MEITSSPNMAVNALADCVFPEDIMLCILTRLPVNSILRFKSVCNPWRHLLSTPEFIKMHRVQFSGDPENESFIIHRINKNGSNTISIFNIESNEKKPTILDHPFSRVHSTIESVGCCNGLFCISHGQMFVLWNPAMKLYKSVWAKEKHFGIDKMVSLGFGYDSVGADFKVVRILCLVNRKGERVSVGAEVYSVNSDSWTTIQLDFQFCVCQTKNDLIVNGYPYWIALFDENEVFVRFDVTQLVFKVVPLSTLFEKVHEEAKIDLVDWNGSLGALVRIMDYGFVESFDEWVFDEAKQVWRYSPGFDPIEMNAKRFLLCSKKWKIIGEQCDGKLFVFLPEADCVKTLFYGAREGQSFDVYGYSESLAYIEGMRKVESRKRTRKMIDDAARSN